jgi:hypothetical protein
MFSFQIRYTLFVVSLFFGAFLLYASTSSEVGGIFRGQIVPSGKGFHAVSAVEAPTPPPQTLSSLSAEERAVGENRDAAKEKAQLPSPQPPTAFQPAAPPVQTGPFLRVASLPLEHDASPGALWMASIVDAHSTASGIFFFTVASIGADYVPLVLNWCLSVEASLGASSEHNARDLARKALVITTGPDQCALLRSRTNISCVFDSFNPTEPKARLLNLKYIWTLAALQRGAAALYNDPDMAYHTNARTNVFDLLVASRITSAAGSSEPLPYLQLLSDHTPCNVVPRHLNCGPNHPFQETLSALARSSSSINWISATIDKISSGSNLECIFVCENTYPARSPCASSGFWFVISRNITRSVFTSMIAANGWDLNEQIRFNTAIQPLLPVMPTLVIDPARIGNVDAQMCAGASLPESGQATPRVPIATHTGYWHGGDKFGAIKMIGGAWYYD